MLVSVLLLVLECNRLGVSARARVGARVASAGTIRRAVIEYRHKIRRSPRTRR
jgi:hypothetical protein